MSNLTTVLGLASIQEADVASAATCDIGAATKTKVNITGVVTITSLGAVAHALRFIRFAAALVLTHNATSLILPGGANITTAAGDTCIACSDGSGNWRVYNYTKATGKSVVLPALSDVTASGALALVDWTDVASAGTTDLGAVASNYVRVTGTVTITALGTAAATVWRIVRFAGALTLTYNATSLILPGAANITTAAGDVAWFKSEGSGNWRCLGYWKASGKQVVLDTVRTRQVFSSGSGTYTTPAGVRSINVRMVGAGSGGQGGGSGSPGEGAAGGNTTFSTLTANGGGATSSFAGGAGGTASGGDVNITGSKGSGKNYDNGNSLALPGATGGASAFGGAGAGQLAVAGSAGSSGGGGGGGCSSGGSGQDGGAGGGAGGYCEKLIASPSATYSYAVGAGGTAGAAGTTGTAGGAGGAGLIIVDEHY